MVRPLRYVCVHYRQSLVMVGIHGSKIISHKIRGMNPIIRVDKSGKVPVYTVKQIHEEAPFFGKPLKESDFSIVLKSDADVYTDDGYLLLRFRKSVLSKDHIDEAYNALETLITKPTTDRGKASGTKEGTRTGKKNKVRSNIIGYFDTWSVQQKYRFKVSGVKPPSRCRITRFTAREPEKWKRTIPLIEEIDAQYENLCPSYYKSQSKAAASTPFRIAKTAFSTVTTNLNFQTAAHYDKGDWDEGFGNLVVIEKGAPYKGAYTGFPAYGVAVDCRTGDFLAMDVHKIHGNSPMIPKDESSKRLSLVCYLRKGIVERCAEKELYDPVALERRITRGIERKRGTKTRKLKRHEK